MNKCIYCGEYLDFTDEECNVCGEENYSYDPYGGDKEKDWIY